MASVGLGTVLQSAAKEIAANRQEFVIAIVPNGSHAGTLAKLLTKAFAIPKSSIVELGFTASDDLIDGLLAQRHPIVIVPEAIVLNRPCRFWAPVGASDICILWVRDGRVTTTHLPARDARFTFPELLQEKRSAAASSPVAPSATPPTQSEAPHRTLDIVPGEVRAIMGAFVGLPLAQSEATSHTWDFARKWNPQLAARLEHNRPDFVVGGIVGAASLDAAIATLKKQLDGQFKGCKLIVQHSGVQVYQRSTNQTVDGIVLLGTFVSGPGGLVTISPSQDLTLVSASPQVPRSQPTGMTGRQKVLVGVLFASSLILLSVSVQMVPASETPRPPVVLMLLPSYVIAAFDCGYVARKRQRSTWWAMLGLLGWFGILLVLTLVRRRKHAP